MLNKQELTLIGHVVDKVMADYAGRDRKITEQRAIIAVTFAAIYSQDAYGVCIPKLIEQNARLELNIFPRK